jgi:hypothetical protein
MPQPDEMESLIRRLAEAEPGQREKAAVEVFRRGTEIAWAAIAGWLRDAELAKLFLKGESNLPETTVGLAVAHENFERIRAAHGSPRLAEVPPDQDAEEFELRFARGVRLDILTTKAPQAAGAIARFLEKFGEGIQQVELLVRDIDHATKLLRKKFALEPIYANTRAGADGTRVNFFLAPTPQGKKVLIELVETSTKTRQE